MNNSDILGLYVQGRLTKNILINIINLKSVLSSIDNGNIPSDEYMKALMASLFPEPQDQEQGHG
ncbi:hypothetical protein GOB86_09525 [Acetobacter lambici]|uniref:Transposase n=1 Tax=Acetobacter lambici TaxID=1332824 RepID=A0ABT1F4C6_9PROT|nr:hypothetical protein [Acetobacter lambici]MCP1242853.1 hypothetical protein [Acetobacter lambici]MCP1258988.1 hypothetical protein [Acetobacter lambici]NHO57295.1 hypothetical protein [Acetobacter lambici]